MIHHPTPRLDERRIEQMIANTISYKQDAQRHWLRDLIARHRPLFYSLGASFVAAAIISIFWLNPTVPHAFIHDDGLTVDTEMSDIMQYDLLDDLSDQS